MASKMGGRLVMDLDRVPGVASEVSVWDGTVLDGTEPLGFEDVRAMARMYTTKVPVRDLAAIFRLGEADVRQLLKRFALLNKGASQTVS